MHEAYAENLQQTDLHADEFRRAYTFPTKRVISAIRRYALTLVFVAAALSATLLLQHVFPYPFLFFAAVMASAWFGGRLAGLFAVLISTLTVDYFFVSPFYSFAINATEGTYFA